MEEQKLSRTGDREDNWQNFLEEFSNIHLKFKTYNIWLIKTTARNSRYTE